MDFNFSGWCVALGGTTALDTLGSQAFTGSDQPASLSIHFQRCTVLLWLLFIPVGLLWYFVKPVLLFLGQDQRLSHDVEGFLRILIIGAPGYIAFESLKKYLQCQGADLASVTLSFIDVRVLSGIMRAATFVLIIVAPINTALNIFCVHFTSLGLLGSPVAISITYWLSFFGLAIFTYLSKAHYRNKTWGGINPKLVFNLSSCALFLRLAIPGILMVGTEW